MSLYCLSMRVTTGASIGNRPNIGNRLAVVDACTVPRGCALASPLFFQIPALSHTRSCSCELPAPLPPSLRPQIFPPYMPPPSVPRFLTPYFLPSLLSSFSPSLFSRPFSTLLLSLPLSLTHVLTHPLSHPFTRSPTQLTNLLTHSLSHPPTHSLSLVSCARSLAMLTRMLDAEGSPIWQRALVLETLRVLMQ
eukprot:5115360-Pleurochrysis_carterae.AAC.3